MTVFEQVLNWGPFSQTRRNHALEHATLQVLAEKIPQLKAAGYSDPKGFWLIGNIETMQVEEAVSQAAARLQGGERNLAIHPHCGTNLVTTGVMAAGAVTLSRMGSRNPLAQFARTASWFSMMKRRSSRAGPFLAALRRVAPFYGNS